jgi:hypothetical protein
VAGEAALSATLLKKIASQIHVVVAANPKNPEMLLFWACNAMKLMGTLVKDARTNSVYQAAMADEMNATVRSAIGGERPQSKKKTEKKTERKNERMKEEERKRGRERERAANSNSLFLLLLLLLLRHQVDFALKSIRTCCNRRYPAAEVLTREWQSTADLKVCCNNHEA